VVHKAQDLRLEERSDPRPSAGEALVKIAKVGVCGSDVHYYFDGGIGTRLVKEPIVLGHECAGEVVEVGPGAEGLKVGERVVIEPGVPCGKCVFCREGAYNNCDHMYFMATPPDDGAFCEYVAWPAAYCYAMPDGMTYTEGAMIEPLAVAVYSVDLCAMKPGASVVILGSAAIGLLTLQCARCAGAGRIIVTDVLPQRLEVAKQLGADVTINAAEEEVAERVMEETGRLGAEIVFEAAGTPATMKQVAYLARPGGKIVIIGICQEDVIPIDFGASRRREVTYQFVRRYRHVFEKSIELVARGRIDVASLVTHNFTLDDIHGAFEVVKHCRDGVLKATVEIAEE